MSERVRNVVAAILITSSLGVILAALTSTPRTDADRVSHLASILKCPVCSNESIASSPSQTARDAQDLIAEQVAAGWSDDQVIDYFVAAYGDDMLLDPPGGGRTLLLWVLPVAAALIGVAVVVGRSRRGDAGELSTADRSRVEAALRQRSPS